MVVPARLVGRGISLYQRFLWGSMDRMGVRTSIERKFIAAMAIQYVTMLAVLALPVAFFGPARVLDTFAPAQLLAVTAVVAVATVAFVNTIWIVRRDIIAPVTELRDVARRLSEGDLDRRPRKPFQPDETGELKRAMLQLHQYLTVTAEQASAVGREEFDAPVLEEPVPGAFGDVLAEMQDRLEERIQEMRTFRAAVESAGHGVLITDVDGTIEYVNPAFEEISGYDREEAIGETPRILNSGEHDKAFYGELWSTILDGDVWEREVINRRKDGTTYDVSQTISPVVVDGEIAHFVSVNNDISALKERERDLERQNERLEEFGRTVAHDLRNPVQTIRGYLDVAKLAEDPEEAHEEIQESVDRMSELIDELLELAKEGQTVVHPAADSLEETARAAWRQANTDSMTLSIVTDEEVMMDQSRIQQLLENLFRNAREHAGADATVRLGSTPTGFYVEDDGPGIPAQYRDDIFETGYTTNEDGTGFGLAIVEQIADAHGWEIEIADGSAGGARFEFHDVEFA